LLELPAKAVVMATTAFCSYYRTMDLHISQTGTIQLLLSIGRRLLAKHITPGLILVRCWRRHSDVQQVQIRLRVLC